MHRNFYYFVGYTLGLTALLGWLVYDLLLISYDEYSFVWHLTEGVKKGILINFVAIFYLIWCRLMQMAVFGELRIIEMEHLMERLPMFVVTLLFNWATTDKEMIVNVVLFGLSISFKVFHIVLMDRMDYCAMKIVNGLELLTTQADVFRQYALNLYFWLVPVAVALDFAVAKLLVYDVVYGVTSVVCLLFGFQFAMQGVETLTYFAKLVLTAYEVLRYRVEPTDDDADIDNLLDDDDVIAERVWEAKPFYSKAIDILLALLKAASHICYVYLLIYELGTLLPPIAMISGTYSALREVYLEVGSLFKFIELARQLDLQLQTATAAELAASDNLCIICMEEMRAPAQYLEAHGKELSKRKIPKKLRCGHFMHAGCLKEWLERTDSCPLCRSKVFGDEPLTPAQEAAALTRDLQAFQPPPPPQPEARPAAPAPTDAGTGGADPATFTGTGSTEPPTEGLSRQVPPTTTIAAPATAAPLQSLPRLTPTPTTLTNNPFTDYTFARHDNDDGHQTISLPISLAVLPPNWILLPMRRSDSGYEVSLSHRHQARLHVVKKDPHAPAPSSGY